MSNRNSTPHIRLPDESAKVGLNAQDSQALIALWIQRKRGLDETQWHRLFVLVRFVLQRCRAPMLEQLPENREYYIHDFFVRKVMETAAVATPLEHVGVLAGYFRNFLTDQTRSAWLKRAGSLEGMAVHERDHLEATASFCDACDCADIDRLLSEAGFTHQEITDSAAAFLSGLSPGEIAYLRYNTCADDPETMSSIAKRMEIANYHEKARKLGITGLKSGFVTGYEKTRIGNWLRSLGIEISLDWWPQLKSVMALLCLAVLSRLEER
ncbi:hypothetical protein MASR1M60_05330 [Rhodocyclaceae bacterium]